MRAWLRRRLGVRMRSALAASLVVAVTSVLAGIAFVLAAHVILVNSVDQSADQRANQVAAALGQTGTASIGSPPRDRTVVQVLDTGGRVLAASVAVDAATPMSPLRPPAGRTLREQRRLDIAHDELFRVVAVGVGTPDGDRIVLVAQSLDEVDDGTEAATGAVLIGLPLLTLIVGAATFLFVGRTLHPVEAMRRQAARISATNLHARLPVPVAEDEIAALATTMNTMLARIEAASVAQRRFVADASHELRGPLSTIHAGLDLLGGAPLPPDIATQVTRMRGESTRMARLVSDLLLLARVDESGLRRRHEDVDLDDLVYGERDRVAAAQPDLRVEVRAAPVRVTGDAHQLQRALRNLVDNAARHARTRLVLTLGADGAWAEITVADDGPGIPEADRERVFDRFVRLDEDRSRLAGGTGLGLPIARDIVAAHGGTVTLAGTPGGGATVRVRLPR
jgi:signal transduction histidine kinase